MSWEDIPVASSSFSPSLGGEKEEDLSTAFKWTPEFWAEPESAGAELVREDILVAGQINVFPGLYEHGKTMVVGDLACKWGKNHGPVLYLDWEMGARRVKRRMQAHGWTWEQAKARWNYAAYPQLKPGELGLWADMLGPDLLVVMDSWHKAMAALGFHENDADSAGAWWAQELGPLRDQGTTVCVVAQTTKAGKGSRGTVSTAFDSDVIWQVERFKKFTPEQAGKIRLTQEKDREGVLPLRVGFELGGDGEDCIRLRRMEDVPKGEPADEALLELVTALLEGPEAEARGGLATSAICAGVDGYGDGKVKTALEQLEKDGLVEWYLNTGTGGGVRWRLIPANQQHNNTAAQDAPSLE